jgi:hypothetical protein
MSETAVVETPADRPAPESGPPHNQPLTDKQKLKLANLHRKMLDKRLAAEQLTREAQNLETLLQRSLAEIAMINGIDFTQYALSEDFEIVPLQQPPSA